MDRLVFDSSNLVVVLPEMFLFGATCVILLAAIYSHESRRGIVYVMSLAALAFTLLLTLRGGALAAEPVAALYGTYVRDPMAVLLKTFVYLVMICVFVYGRDYLDKRGLNRGEFYVLALCGTLGMMVMISAGSLLTLYLGLELLALSSYALVALHRDSYPASESAMKYFVLGALASGLLLYGMSMVYGATGTLDLQAIGSLVDAATAGDDLVLVFGLVFLVVGLAFKLGAVPFHMWLPDVYEGSPTAVTLFLSSAPKIAAFAMAIRLLDDALIGLYEHWHLMLIALAVASLAIGNVVAIAQENLKRMLAYSTISHVGFMLLGILAGTAEGYAASMFYAIVYAFMSAGAFGVILLLTRQGFEADRLDDFKGLNRRSPWFAFMMLLLMGSLAGFPPLVGFFAKLQVIKAAVDAGLLWLAVFAVVFAVIGAFYYLRVIWYMYMEDDEDQLEESLEAPFDMKALLTVNGLMQLFLGLAAAPLIAACVTAFS